MLSFLSVLYFDLFCCWSVWQSGHRPFVPYALHFACTHQREAKVASLWWDLCRQTGHPLRASRLQTCQPCWTINSTLPAHSQHANRWWSSIRADYTLAQCSNRNHQINFKKLRNCPRPPAWQKQCFLQAAAFKAELFENVAPKTDPNMR